MVLKNGRHTLRQRGVPACGRHRPQEEPNDSTFAKKPGERSAPPTWTRQERIAMSQPCAPLMNLPVHEAARFVLEVRERWLRSPAPVHAGEMQAAASGGTIHIHRDDVDGMRP